MATDCTMFCKHGGVIPPMKRTCTKGHDVRSLVGGSDYGWLARAPCVINKLSRDPVDCPDREQETAEDHFREILEWMNSATEEEIAEASLCDGRSIGPGGTETEGA